MKIQGIFALLYVADIARAEDWYTRLIGREPDDRPMETLVQWRENDLAGIQLFLDPERAGNSGTTIVTPSMSATRAALEAGGIELQPDVQGDFGVIAQTTDPDGNQITLAEPPRGF